MVPRSLGQLGGVSMPSATVLRLSCLASVIPLTDGNIFSRFPRRCDRLDLIDRQVAESLGSRSRFQSHRCWLSPYISSYVPVLNVEKLTQFLYVKPPLRGLLEGRSACVKKTVTSNHKLVLCIGCSSKALLIDFVSKISSLSFTVSINVIGHHALMLDERTRTFNNFI